MREEFRPAIEALQKDLADLEQKAAETKGTINRLCVLAGAPEMYQDASVTRSAATITSIRADTFYGKVLTTAAREFLEMRKAANLGPATTREIYDAIVSGGFEFETSDPTNAMTGMRQTMSRNSGIFHRLPNNSWGLVGWYERIKANKAAKSKAEEQPDSEETETADDQ